MVCLEFSRPSFITTFIVKSIAVGEVLMPKVMGICSKRQNGKSQRKVFVILFIQKRKFYRKIFILGFF